MFFFFSSRRRHTRWTGDWSSDMCSSDLILERRTDKDSLLAAHARKLYDELLRPAESLLANADRLLIVPDGALHLLPFEALMRASDHYLVEWKPLNTVVSATVFAELKKARHQESKPIEL